MGQSPALYADSRAVQLLEPWIRRHLAATNETVLRRFIQLTTGIFEQRSVLMERIAEGNAFRATMERNTTQVRRILRDTRIHLETLYYPLIKSLLAELPNNVLYLSMDESAHTDTVRLFQVGLITDACTLGKTMLNRGHEHHRSMSAWSALERRPRCVGGCQRGGGTWWCNSALTVQRWSVMPAAIAGVRRPPSFVVRLA